MTKKLFIEVITKFTLGVILIGALIFLPAGTLNFFGGWLFMGILFVPMFIAGIVMMFKNPEYINNSVETAPSKRLMRIIDNYSKLLYNYFKI